jgi:hypothetical protein
MLKTTSFPGALALLAAALAWPQSPAVRPAAAQEAAAPATAEEIAALRREIQALRDQVATLRRQVDSLGAPAAAGAFVPVPAAPSATPGAVPEAPTLPGAVAVTRRQNLLNPAISAVFQAIGNTSLRRESDASGFDLSEAELAFQSAVDPFTKVDLFLAFPAGETPEIEEGFITTLALPGPLQLKGGRFKSAFGKWNTLHAHQFFTVEKPNVLENFFGEESLTSDGLSLSVLIPNPWDLYLDALTEVGTALEGIGFNGQRRNLTYLEHLAAFFNPTVNSTVEVGLTAAFGKTGASDSLIQAIDDADLTGTLAPRDELDSRVRGIDLTWKWKPLQRNVYRSFLWQTEVLTSRRDVEVLSGLALEPAVVSSLGGYSYLEAQFTKRWRFGARFDLSDFPDAEGDRERALSAVVRFQPSEFQEIRFQVKRTARNDGAALRFDGDEEDTRLFFEWIPVIGAHGAHKY